MQFPSPAHPECFIIQERISSLRSMESGAQMIIDDAKDRIVNNCENLDSDEREKILGAYTSFINLLSEVQADIESAQSRYEELCVLPSLK